MNIVLRYNTLLSLILLTISITLTGMEPQHTTLAMVIAEEFKNVPEPDPSLEPVKQRPDNGTSGGMNSTIQHLRTVVLQKKDHIICSDAIIQHIQTQLAQHVPFFKNNGITKPNEQIFVNERILREKISCICQTNTICHCLPDPDSLDNTKAGFYSLGTSKTNELYNKHALQYLNDSLPSSILDEEYDIYTTTKGAAYCKKKNIPALFTSNDFKQLTSLTEYQPVPSTQWTKELPTWCTSSANAIQQLQLMGHGSDRTVCSLPHKTAANIIHSLKLTIPNLHTLTVSSCYNDAKRVVNILGNNNQFTGIVCKAQGPEVCAVDNVYLRSYNPTTKNCTFSNKLGINSSPIVCLDFSDLTGLIGQHITTAKSGAKDINAVFIKNLVTRYQDNQPHNKPSVLIDNKPLALLLAENK